MKVGIVGLGKLGLPLALLIGELSSASVYAFDINTEVLLKLKNGEFKTPEPNLIALYERVKAKIEFTHSISDLSECDLIYIVVPTPSLPNGHFDSTLVREAVNNILKNCIDIPRKIELVIVSTVMPGTCASLKKSSEKVFAFKNLKVEFVYSPEFIALGTVIKDMQYPDMTLIGVTNVETETLHKSVTKEIVKNNSEIVQLTLEEAEVTKILVNSYVTMKISFANFIMELSENEGLDARRIAWALGHDSRIGARYLRPGLGFAGPCFPRDNKATVAYARSIGIEASLSIATDEINNRLPSRTIEKLRKVFETKFTDDKPKRIGIFGASYKVGSNVIEGSQSLQVARILACEYESFNIVIFDPALERDGIFEIEGIEVYTLERMKEVDFAIFATPWPEFNAARMFYFQNSLDIW